MDAERACEALALRLLANREHSRHELLQKLRARCTCHRDHIAQLLDKLQHMGYLDDARYSAAFVRAAIGRGRGAQRIIYELREHGIDPELATQALAEAGIDWGALARQERIKKYGRKIPEAYQERARQARFLAGRGFSKEAIQAAFQNHADY